MAITNRTLAEAARMRAAVNAVVNDTTHDLVASWVQAWDELLGEWDRTVTALTSGDSWPTRAQLMRADHLWSALEATEKTLQELAEFTGNEVLGKIPKLAVDSSDSQRLIVASQFPSQAGSLAQVAASLPSVSQQAIEAIVARTSQQITNPLYLLSPEATARMRAVLIRGVAFGDNPRQAASIMLKRLEHGFNGGLTRAMVITRTEMLDAYRAAAQAQDEVMPHVVQDWSWLATLDARTCGSCLSMHGRRFPVHQPGPNDHQQGRCARISRTRSWAELGYPDIPEPPDLMPDAKAWFEGLPVATQIHILGQERLSMLNSGVIDWDDLSMTKTTPGWRDSQVMTPVKTLRDVHDNLIS